MGILYLETPSVCQRFWEGPGRPLWEGGIEVRDDNVDAGGNGAGVSGATVGPIGMFEIPVIATPAKNNEMLIKDGL
jgi:hypothetical protein